ncbi:MAG: hypothetical protein PHP82_03090 [Candidatus ainarchaeum sp.]|nr:hypothetical protein [Candidatus ainarchaeum sp.]
MDIKLTHTNAVIFIFQLIIVLLGIIFVELIKNSKITDVNTIIILYFSWTLLISLIIGFDAIRNNRKNKMNKEKITNLGTILFFISAAFLTLGSSFFQYDPLFAKLILIMSLFSFLGATTTINLKQKLFSEKNELLYSACVSILLICLIFFFYLLLYFIFLF